MTQAKLVWVVLLLVVVTASAIAIAHSKFEQRQLIKAQRELSLKRDQEQVRWRQLALDLETLVVAKKVRVSAVGQLGMRAPRNEDIRLIWDSSQ